MVRPSDPSSRAGSPLLRSLGRAAFAAVLATAALAAAKPVPKGIAMFRVLGPDQGLTSASVWAVAQDGQGLLWAATESGVFRYDGRTFKAFGIKEGLPSAFVDALHVDPRGRMWAATYGGLAWFAEGRFHRVDPGAGLPEATITAISDGPGGRLWVGTPAGLYVSGDGGTFRPAPGWDGSRVTALLWDPAEEAIWAAAWHGSRSSLRRWRWGTWQDFQGPKGFFLEKIDALARDGSAKVWARSLHGLWFKDPGGGGFRAPEPGVAPIGQKGRLHVDPEGSLWVPTDEGLVKIGPGGRELLGVRDGLPFLNIRGVRVDREGSLWIAGDGLAKLLGGGMFTISTAARGLPSDVVWAVLRDREGDLLVGTDRGLAQWTGTAWKTVRGTENFQVRTILQGPDGALWAAGGPTVLRIDLRSHAVTRFGTRQGVLSNGRIYRLAFDPQGRLWVATDGGGLVRGERRQGTWAFAREALPGAEASEWIADLLVDGRGRLWAAGERGLAVLDGEGWRRFTERDGLRGLRTSYLAQRRDGTILVAYFDPLGIFEARCEGGALRILRHLDDTFPQDRKVYLMGEDRAGGLWVGTDQGLLYRDPHGRVESFRRGEGLASEDMNAMAFLAEEDGTVWFGSSGGLVRFDPRRYRGVPPPPPTAILESRLGALRWPEAPPEGVQVPSDAGTFEVHFATPAYARESAVQRQVRLLGLEPAWRPSDALEERYAALPIGRYRFEVQSRIGREAWGPPAAFPFEVRPAWWQTWWFRTLELLGAAGAFLLVLWWRMAMLKRRNRMLEAMVDARTRELGAANEALRNQSLTDPLTGLRNRRFLAAAMEEDAARILRDHRDALARGQDPRASNLGCTFAMIDLDHFKRVNDTRGHGAGDAVLQQAAAILKQATRSSDSLVRWGGEEFLVVARGTVRSEAPALMERIRAAVEAHRFDPGHGEPLSLTCSIGYCHYPFLPHQPDLFTWEQVIDLADLCLYAAKRAGRNAWVGLDPMDGVHARTLREALPHAAGIAVHDGLLAVATNRDALHETSREGLEALFAPQAPVPGSA